jgi:hypothetical protein
MLPVQPTADESVVYRTTDRSEHGHGGEQSPICRLDSAMVLIREDHDVAVIFLNLAVSTLIGFRFNFITSTANRDGKDQSQL